ncbi:hypothetical protein [Hamadaea tsunoensis]|uniref:hypothetical protein n=1 Tax=Hamadaea tsunoensis TaxID=53368 RepID=UPI0004852336|nr:hypothetical protein [Hamadaea tsunoensis]
MAGYANTPLPAKLGIRTGHRVAVLGGALPGGLPPDVTAVDSLTGPLDVVVVFVTARADLAHHLPRVRAAMAPAAGFWVAWPKKAAVKAGLADPTDMTEDAIRDLALPTGLVDNKVCAIDDVWSGLRLVIRRELR